MNGLPASVLFACSQNSIRSPMAEALAKRLYGQAAYIDSVGVRAAERRRLRRRGARRDRHRRPPPSRQDVRRRRSELVRPDRHAVARGASPGAGIHPRHGGRGRILAGPRSQRRRRLARDAARCLSPHARPDPGAPEGALRRAFRRRRYESLCPFWRISLMWPELVDRHLDVGRALVGRACQVPSLSRYRLLTPAVAGAADLLLDKASSADGGLRRNGALGIAGKRRHGGVVHECWSTRRVPASGNGRAPGRQMQRRCRGQAG